jgi:hypothetical protein
MPYDFMMDAKLCSDFWVIRTVADLDDGRVPAPAPAPEPVNPPVVSPVVPPADTPAVTKRCC